MPIANISSLSSPTQAPFLRPRREKLFGFGDVVPLDHSQKHLCLDFCEAFRRCRLLTRDHVAVFRSLLFDFHNSRKGWCFPSYDALSLKAEVSRRTVARALVLFEKFGLLAWSHRLKREGAGRGRAPLRASNSYRFVVPASLEAAQAIAAGFAASAAAAASFAGRAVRLFSSVVANAALSSVSRVFVSAPSVSQERSPVPASALVAPSDRCDSLSPGRSSPRVVSSPGSSGLDAALARFSRAISARLSGDGGSSDG